jgi:membrane-bound lytic murein transglycosylase B
MVPPSEQTTSSTTSSTILVVPVPATAVVVPAPTTPPTTASAPLGEVEADLGEVEAVLDEVEAVLDEVEAVAVELAEHERIARDPASDPSAVSAAARSAQVIYRRVARTPGWPERFLAELPPSLTAAATSHIEARREFEALVTRLSDTVPAWRIVEPPPLAELRAAYQQGEDVTGVPWEILAAINLVETGFGRIRGLSTAGARGPMQFLPSTWDIHGQGGDIDDPADAIAAAARFLAAHGASADLDGALYRYNNSNHYVRGVRNYAAILEDDPSSLAGLWSWDVIFRSTAADLRLEVGYEEPEAVDAAAWLAEHPDALVSW